MGYLVLLGLVCHFYFSILTQPFNTEGLSVDNELHKSEQEYSSFRDLSMLLVSWNCDSARPDSLVTAPINYEFLNEALTSVDSPDIIAFGFQEVIDLESRKMTAKNVLLGGKKKTEDNGLSDKVTGAYKRWYDRLTAAVRTAMPPSSPYVCVHTENLVGLFTCIFVKASEQVRLDDVAVTTIKRGMGGRYGNKVRFMNFVGCSANVLIFETGSDCCAIYHWRFIGLYY